MEITYALTKDDLWQFHLFCTAKQLHLPPAFLRVLDVVYAGIWVYLAYLLARRVWLYHFLLGYGYSGWKFFFFLHHRGLINLALYTAFLAYLFAGQKWLTLRKLGTHPLLSAPTVRILRPDALYSQIGGQKSFLPWDKFQSVAEDGKAVYRILQKNNAVIVPGRAFADRAAFAEFVRAARGFQQAAAALPPASERAPASNGAPERRAWPADTSQTVWPPPPGQR